MSLALPLRAGLEWTGLVVLLDLSAAAGESAGGDDDRRTTARTTTAASATSTTTGLDKKRRLAGLGPSVPCLAWVLSPSGVQSDCLWRGHLQARRASLNLKWMGPWSRTQGGKEMSSLGFWVIARATDECAPVGARSLYGLLRH